MRNWLWIRWTLCFIFHRNEKPQGCYDNSDMSDEAGLKSLLWSQCVGFDHQLFESFWSSLGIYGMTLYECFWKWPISWQEEQHEHWEVHLQEQQLHHHLQSKGDMEYGQWLRKIGFFLLIQALPASIISAQMYQERQQGVASSSTHTDYIFSIVTSNMLIGNWSPALLEEVVDEWVKTTKCNEGSLTHVWVYCK